MLWGLKHLREFGNTVEDHHALSMGLFFLPWSWWLIVKYGASSEASKLMTAKPWYIALGGWVQLFVLIPLAITFWTFILIILWRLLCQS